MESEGHGIVTEYQTPNTKRKIIGPAMSEEKSIDQWEEQLSAEALTNRK